jgi:hypothetical protein
MDPLSPAVISLAWPLFVNRVSVGTGRSYAQTTITSVTYKGVESLPLEATGLEILSVPTQSAALDWMMLAKEALPGASPLTPDERLSINEFFWSHFK